ncbi:MAG: RelA/SpoT family protein [Candidatus Kapaibacterium sp.]
MFNIDIKKIIRKGDKQYILGESAHADLEVLINKCKQTLPNPNIEIIKKAFHTCYEVHKDKNRKSGMPYYTHPLAVSMIVMNEIPLDETSVVAALLHNTLDDPDKYTVKDLRSEFGSTVADIVEGISKIRYIESYKLDHLNQLENYRKLLLSLFKDVRIILIKLADRLHNMRTLQFISPDTQIRIAKETLEIYAPFANRFGLRNIKWELEDLSFKYINRPAYDEIKKTLYGTRKDREEYIKQLISPIKEKIAKDEFLKKNKLKFEIHGRPKHIYSIYNKMKIRKKGIDELYDLFAVRIILDSDDPYMCFYVYGLVGSVYPPVPETFKDYISSPKKNGYQSIHTAVVGIDNKPVEVQIRTKTMHEISERGVAAHFNYKRGPLNIQSVLDDRNIQEWMSIVREIFENAGDPVTRELMESVRRDIFLDEINVVTPANEFRTLPKDSTPLDFAFDIHTEIGYHCIGAKVNGRIVPLNHRLRNGDQVEILTSQNQKPNSEWLKFVVTSRAKSQIHKYLRDERRAAIDQGRLIWKKACKDNSVKTDRELFEEILKSIGYENGDEFYLALGNDEISVEKIIHLLRIKIRNGVRDSREFTRTDNNALLKQNAVKGIADGYIKRNGRYRTVIIAPCCNPVEGDHIKGYKVADDEIVIHRSDCRRISGLLSSGNPMLISITWDEINPKKQITDLAITGEDRPAMMNDISRIIMAFDGANINGVSFDTNDNMFEGIVSLDIKSPEHVDNMISEIYRVPGVKKVEKLYNG